MDFFGDETQPEEALFRALARAEDRVSRLDERARASGFVDGWRRRADVRTVLALAWNEGHIVHPEDLILHRLGSDVRIPDREVIQAAATLRAREKAWRGGAEMLSWLGVAWLAARVKQAPPSGVLRTVPPSASRMREGLLREIEARFARLQNGHSEDPRAGVEECLEVLEADAPSPPLLVAACLLESWRLVDPMPSHRYLGGLMGSLFLKTSGRFTSGLFPLEIALRRRGPPARLAWAPVLERLTFWLATMERSADLELEELARLSTQKALAERRLATTRRSSNAAALIALAVYEPALTVEMIASTLDITPQGAGALLKRFEGALHEITGRTRYRVWRL